MVLKVPVPRITTAGQGLTDPSTTTMTHDKSSKSPPRLSSGLRKRLQKFPVLLFRGGVNGTNGTKKNDTGATTTTTTTTTINSTTATAAEKRDGPASLDIDNNNNNNEISSWMQQHTRVVTVVEEVQQPTTVQQLPQPLTPQQEEEIHDHQHNADGGDDNEKIGEYTHDNDDDDDDDGAILQPYGPFCASAAILRHPSYFERLLCGGGRYYGQQRPFQQQHPPSGSTTSHDSSSDDDLVQRFMNKLPDDPSVQESIECVLAAQQEFLLELNNNHDENDDMVMKDLPTPSSLQQCLLKNRIPSAMMMVQQQQQNRPSTSPLQNLRRKMVLPMSKSPRKALSPSAPSPQIPNSASLINPTTAIETKTTTLPSPPSMEPSHDAKIPEDSSPAAMDVDPVAIPAVVTTEAAADESSRPCMCHCRTCPILPPEQWPQRPLLLRPTPNGGTKVTGIRFAKDTDAYLWSSSSGTSQKAAAPLTWPEALRKHWNTTTTTTTKDGSMIENNENCTKTETQADVPLEMCPQCMIVPINNGKELPGESLVIDFESPLFRGSMMIRLKDCTGTTSSPHHETKSGGYFDGLHRRYQVVIRGQFKQAIPWTECLTGFQLERPTGKLPAKWIVNGALNVVRFFAPLLQTSISGPRPYSLTPLGSTPQALVVSDAYAPTDSTTTTPPASMEVSQEEPTEDAHTLLGHASTATSSLQRARYRKKHFDKLYAAAHDTNNKSGGGPSSSMMMTDPNKVYTFEFLQHLLSFDDFSIELGSLVGSVPLKNILNGQPLQIMASHKHPIPLSSVEQKPPPPQDFQQNRLWCFDIWHEMLIPDAMKLERIDAE